MFAKDGVFLRRNAPILLQLQGHELLPLAVQFVTLTDVPQNRAIGKLPTVLYAAARPILSSKVSNSIGEDSGCRASTVHIL